MLEEGSSKSNFTLYPLMWLSICFASGVLLERFFDFGWQFYLALILICGTLALLFLKSSLILAVISISYISAGALSFAVQNQPISRNRLKHLYTAQVIMSGDPIEIEGTLVKEPEPFVGGLFLWLKTEKAIYKSKSVEISGIARFSVLVDSDEKARDFADLGLQYGSNIRIASNLKRQDQYRNPGVTSRIEIMDQQGIDATGSIKSPLLIEKIFDNGGFSPIGTIYQVRQTLIQQFRERFKSKTAGIMIASLLGNKYFLDKQTAEAFREGGTFHVLVISGLHITFFGGILLLLITSITRKINVQFVFVVVILWAYALAVGAEIPVVRAALMFSVLLFSTVIHRNGSLLNSLGVSVLILLVWRPEDIFSQSFLLTITSVTAIIAMAFPVVERARAIGNWTPSLESPLPADVPDSLRRFCEMIYWKQDVWEKDVARQIWSAKLFKSPFLVSIAKWQLQTICRYLFEGILVSLVVQIWLLPFLIVYFHRISFFNIFLNLWVGVIIAIESFASLIAILVSQINDNLGQPFILLTEFLTMALLSASRLLVDFDIASARVPVYSGMTAGVYFVYFIPLIVMAFLTVIWNPFVLRKRQQFSILRIRFSRNRIAAIASFFVIMFLLTIVFHPFSEPRSNKRLTVEFLDVGQGDSAFITFPNGKTMLIDGGGIPNFDGHKATDEERQDKTFEPNAFSIGEAVVSEFLWEKGYSRVDYILATHADTDHIQGLTDVAKNFRVKQAIFGAMPFGDQDFDQLYSVLQRKKIDSVLVSRGETFVVGDVKLEILYPENVSGTETTADNNHSIVLRIIYGNRKFLFTGDIEKETEQILAKNSAIDADILKVAHHGSRTSSIPEFVSAVRPKYAIIPVGRESRFGHPHKEVVERWSASGAKVLTTGERGTVSISTDGRDFIVNSFEK